MAHNITTAKGRHALAPRPSVYYGTPLDKGLYLGIRRLPGGGSWVTRYRPPMGDQVLRTLGPVAGLDDAADALEYAEAAELARDWLVELKSGRPARSGKITVREVVNAYLDDLALAEVGERRRARHHAGENAATEARNVMMRRLLGHPVGHPERNPAQAHPLSRRPVDEVTKVEFKQWRKGLRSMRGKPLAIGSVDKYLGIFIAALNYGVRENMVTPSRSREWIEGLQKSGIVERRELYLDQAQRRQFIDAAYTHSNELGLYVEAIALTGMRPGEAAALTVDRFKPEHGVLNIKVSKTGPRKVPLTAAAIAHFKKCARLKLPRALLLPTPTGEAWDFNTARPACLLARESGLPHDTVLYTLRHSWITQALTGQTINGRTEKLSTLFVARSTGTSLEMIERHYGHLAEDEVSRMRAFAFA